MLASRPGGGGTHDDAHRVALAGRAGYADRRLPCALAHRGAQAALGRARAGVAAVPQRVTRACRAADRAAADAAARCHTTDHCYPTTDPTGAAGAPAITIAYCDTPTPGCAPATGRRTRASATAPGSTSHRLGAAARRARRRDRQRDRTRPRGAAVLQVLDRARTVSALAARRAGHRGGSREPRRLGAHA